MMRCQKVETGSPEDYARLHDADFFREGIDDAMPTDEEVGDTAEALLGTE
jgi:hypothetical protein